MNIAINNPGGAELKQEIKRVIVDACELTIAPEAIGDDDLLIGSESALGLDSLDALQAAVALSKRFGRRIHDGNHARRVMRSVNTLAEFIEGR
jgi:acyl carrier protein